jgi:hypothetical protein
MKVGLPRLPRGDVAFLLPPRFDGNTPETVERIESDQAAHPFDS